MPAPKDEKTYRKKAEALDNRKKNAQAADKPGGKRG